MRLSSRLLRSRLLGVWLLIVGQWHDHAVVDRALFRLRLLSRLRGRLLIVRQRQHQAIVDVALLGLRRILLLLLFVRLFVFW